MILFSLGMSGFRSSPGDSDEEFESVSQVTGPVSNTFHLLTRIYTCNWFYVYFNILYYMYWPCFYLKANCCNEIQFWCLWTAFKVYQIIGSEMESGELCGSWGFSLIYHILYLKKCLLFVVEKTSLECWGRFWW